MLRYFKGAFAFTAVCLGLAVWLGWSMTGTAVGTAGVLWIVLVLSVLEVSLSFDNAVVNAAVLRDMSPLWRRRFLTWGIAISVFGMRVIFPLVIVALAANNPAEYERIITSAHVGIAGFGGAFLAMVGLKFFFDQEKDVHWIDVIEERLAKLSSVHAIEIGIVLLALYGISTMLVRDEAFTLIVSGIFGILAYLAVEAVNSLLEPEADATGTVVRSGLAGFLYLNLLDSAFSFDGVIGAFALTNNIFIIALGLGIGAIFVRSMTIMLVDKGTLAQYRYLEHGAFWAIIALAVILLLSARFHIPEAITGLIGAVLIGASLYWSVRHKRLYPDASEDFSLDAPKGGAADDPVLPTGKHLNSK